MKTMTRMMFRCFLSKLLEFFNTSSRLILSFIFSFRCHICSEDFKQMHFLSTHTKTFHDCLPRVECKCGKFIGSTKALLYHYEQHVKCRKMLHCSECNKLYKTQSKFDIHMQMHNQPEDRKYQCGCGKWFKEARHLAVHSNSHLPDDLKYTHVCRFCNKKYSSVFSLRQHIKHVHINVSKEFILM